jgi:CRISPR-associated protein Csd1
MILKALYDYYQHAEGMAPDGMEYKEIGFVIILDRDGHFLRLEDRRIDKRRCNTYLVAKSIGRTSAPVANLLWDNSDYVLGYSAADAKVEEVLKKPESERTAEDLKKIQDSEKAHKKSAKVLQTFRDKVAEMHSKYPDHVGLAAVYNFYRQDPAANLEQLHQDLLWDSFRRDLTKNISFQLNGELRLVAEEVAQLELESGKSESSTTDGQEAICLVLGERSVPVATTNATAIPGSKANAKLVAFQVNSGYDSYGHTQCANAPISPQAEFAYTTALNHMLAKDSRNKFSISQQTYVFWASTRSAASIEMEQGIFALLGRQDEGSDDPNRGILEVRKTFMDIYSGASPSTSEDRFYILGLAPNSARIAVVYWQELQLKEFAHNLLCHFDDMEIVDNRKEEKKPAFGLYSILGAVTLGGKQSDALPNMADAVVKSIMSGCKYPDTLYQACLRRLRADQTLSVTRLGILKAYINRYERLIHTPNTQPLQIMLDKDNTNIGYLCGRLFAVLEHAQRRANGTVTICERYMNAAGSTPAIVFPTLLNLNVHHLEKLEERTKVYIEKLKGEIMEALPVAGFPAHLSLTDQGRFFVGFYHQRQALFTKKEAPATNE